MKKSIFNGVGTALITPFNNGAIDTYAFELLIDKQIQSNVDAIVVLGTTGEAPTISEEERERIIKLAVKKCENRCKVIVGTGSNSTKKAIDYYKTAEVLGADGALIVTPYYNKCTQDGLINHYTKIAESGNLPIIVYNVPSRTGVNILPETMEKLSDISNICGIKEASGNITQIIDLFNRVGNKVAIYSGDDLLNNIFMFLGGSGSISVLSNLAPKLCVKLNGLFVSNQHEIANKIFFELIDLIKCLFLEVNPIPIKAGLCYLGLCKDELRMPLTNMSKDSFEKLKIGIDKAFEKYDCM